MSHTPRKPGRPRKSDPPALDYDVLDRLLVHGEVAVSEDGKTKQVQFPSHRDLGERFGVASSLIAQYSKSHNCMARRHEAQMRVRVKADNKMIERRAQAIAVNTEYQLRVIDEYILGFSGALQEGRVRFDNPTDLNQMVRLRAFLTGGADSRQEVHASLSLESLQARYKSMMRAELASTSEQRGEVLEENPPTAAATDSDYKLTEQLDDDE